MPNLLADDQLVHRITDAVCGAARLDHVEPWVRLTEPNVIEVHADVGPAQRLADPSGRARFLSVGAALFSLRLAIRCTGLEPVVRLFPDVGSSAAIVATVQLIPGGPATAAESELFAAMEQPAGGWRQRMHRLSPQDRERLERAASAEHAVLRLLSGAETAELRARIAMEEGELEGGGLVSSTRPHVLHPALGVLTAGTTGRDGPRAWLVAGQALQRVLLTATACGLAATPLYQPIEVHDMLAETDWWPAGGAPQVLIEVGPGGGHGAMSVVPVAAVPPRRRALRS